MRTVDRGVNIGRYLDSGQIEQVICGGEDYDGARLCDLEWAKDLRRECGACDIAFCFIETGTDLIKDGKEYYLPKKVVQSRMAFKSGMSYVGREIPEKGLHVVHYGKDCGECGDRLIRN